MKNVFININGTVHCCYNLFGSTIRNNYAFAKFVQLFKEKCNEILNDTTVITSTTVRGCNIEVENVSVTNNSKLFLDAVFETTVNGSFEV